jgi:hypothetical protein
MIGKIATLASDTNTHRSTLQVWHAIVSMASFLLHYEKPCLISN